MRNSISNLALAALGATLLIGSAQSSMARDGSSHHLTVTVHRPRAAAGSDARGFGGFSGSKGHPFFMGHDYGKGHHYEYNWDRDPFWTPDSYYLGPG